VNANHTHGTRSGVPLLKKSSFADLRGAKFFRSVRLVPAVGLELATQIENAQVLLITQKA
jgi:hypothetical protein